jgi:tetrahydromethanopterin S-methyltransferase subunit F
MILVVVTGLVVGFLAAGVFVGVLDQLTTASR